MSAAVSFTSREMPLPIQSDSLAQFYSSLADDGSSSGKKREAAASLVLAQGYMDKMAYAEAARAAQEALSGFKSVGDKTGQADSLRTYTQVLSFQRKDKAAIAAIQEQLSAASGSAVDKARIELIFAEQNFPAGSANLAQAETYAKGAVAAFKDAGDKKYQAMALVALANVYCAKVGDVKKNAEDAKTALSDAVPIFKELGDARGEASALHAMGMARLLSGATEGAIRAGKEALAIYEKAGIKSMEAAEMNYIATWHLADGDFDEALFQAEEAMDVYQEKATALPAEGVVLETIVTACLKKSQPKTALRAIKDTLERFEESGDAAGEAAAYSQMCEAYCALGDGERAIKSAQSAADEYSELKDSMNEAKELRKVARIYMAVKDFEPALKSAQAALELFEQADDLPAQAVTLMLRSSVYLEMLEFGSAIRCITEAKELYQDVGDKEGEVATLLQLSDVSMKSEDYAGAMKFAQDAQALSDEAGDAKGTASALRLQADIHIIQEDLDSAMRCAEKAMSGFREAEDRVEEVNMVVTLITVRIMILVKKDKEGKTSAKTIKDGVDKVSKLAKDALSTARKEGIKSLTGAAHYALCQVQLLNGEVKKAMASAQEALTIFTEANDERYEANVLTMQANILLAMKDYRLAKEKAEEAIFVFQKVGDAKGEDQAWECVDEVEKIEAEIREAEQARQMAQWQAQQAMAGGGGLTLQPIQQQAAGPDEGAEPSAARGGYEAKLVKMDLASGMDATVIRQQVHEITKGIIGFDEDIEYDMPLMESGLTSNTAVLLRDSLVQQLPGVPLPVTLIFDYPSIQSMTELIVENGEKAAKKAAKLANK